MPHQCHTHIATSKQTAPGQPTVFCSRFSKFQLMTALGWIVRLLLKKKHLLISHKLPTHPSYHTLFRFRFNITGERKEGLFNIDARFRRCLHEFDSVFDGQLFPTFL